ncbi:MAG: hypothetical protein QM516_13015 [Limnohabitans sp.]|jgi:hypothetical protein|nr:hypothetical protein [Limnohabitans sp.]
MFEIVWPTLPPEFRTELILQCVRHLKETPDDLEAFARVIASAINARPQSVKAQWRLSDTFGTTRALARDPRFGTPFFAMTYMGARKTDLGALYDALGVKHNDLNVDDFSATEQPPTQAQFATALAKGLEGVSRDSLHCMVAIIADVGIEAWQAPAREALRQHLAAKS